MSAQGLPQHFSTPPSLRGRLRFSVEGLSARDELLFKSLVRLLDHRTHQGWSYSMERPHLRVIGEGFLPQISESFILEFSKVRFSVLVVGHSQQQHANFLHLPLHANELELMLNKLGPCLASFDAAPAIPVISDVPIGDEDAFTLLKWPPAVLLGTPIRVKLATLMLGKSMTILLLQKRSGLSAQQCAEFIDCLMHAQLLTRAGTGDRKDREQQNASVVLSALSLVRSQAVAKEIIATSTSSKVSIGLLARIRNRLGLSAPTSA